MVSSELVKPALCFIVLMVSLSKCEIDSSIVKVQPSGVPPRGATTPSDGGGGGKISQSFSSSSSSSTAKHTTMNTTPKSSTPPPQHQSGGGGHNNTKIISTTATFAVATLATPPLQKEGREVGQPQQTQRHEQEHQQHLRSLHIPDGGSVEIPPSGFGPPAKREMTGIGQALVGRLGDTSAGRAEGTTFPRYSERRFSLQPRRDILGEVLARDDDDDGSSLETNPDSPIPTHTGVPAGLTFSCKDRVPGYYADASKTAKCQVYHMCMTDGRKYTMLCGVGTVFNQITFVCDHWYNYKCSDAERDYKINSQLWQDFISDNDDQEDLDDGEGTIQQGIVPPPP